MENVRRSHPAVTRTLHSLIGITLLAIYAQLIVGATMRHFQAGLAIPDLPLAYHHLLPPTDSAQLSDANSMRAFGDFGAPLPPVTLWQIWLHFAHRCGAVVVTCLLGTTVTWILLKIDLPTLRTLAWTLAALLLTQLTLGVLTVLWRKPADIASTHVVVGAATLMTTFILYIRTRQFVSLPSRIESATTIAFPQLSPVSA